MLDSSAVRKEKLVCIPAFLLVFDDRPRRYFWMHFCLPLSKIEYVYGEVELFSFFSFNALIIVRL